MQGAEYGVYKTEADAKADKNKVNTLTIGKYDSSEKYKDWSNEMELDAGTYYLKEIKNLKGYALNNSVVTVIVKANEILGLAQMASLRIILNPIQFSFCW